MTDSGRDAQVGDREVSRAASGSVAAAGGRAFSTLTTGRYATLKVNTDAPSSRLLGMRDDMRTMVEVDAMRRGHHRPAFSSRCGWPRSSSLSRRVGLPFLADDLFVNFDDRRAGQASVSSPRSPGSTGAVLHAPSAPGPDREVRGRRRGSFGMRALVIQGPCDAGG
jgi:hypothetical protein